MTVPPTAEPGLLAALGGLRATPPPDFADRVLTRLGLQPEADQFLLVDGPTEPLFVAFNRHGICHVLAARMVDGSPDRFMAIHRRRFDRSARPAARPPAGLVAALRTGRSRQLAFDLRGLTEFEQAVLRKALDIPSGEIRPYAWVAREIGRPKAVRAVGTALGRNPVPVLIPCHRVVRSDGTIGRYAFGTPMKRELLGAEALDVEENERRTRAGVHYVGSDSNRVYCFPTCHHARRITDTHRVTFRTSLQAETAGYRACADCRPGDARGA
ncbi:MAG: methylated-DNA--[protein]-cysteine S-methyltransferase [Acidimicrobiales bacterium]|jgi:O-6-methylguanine DNA methyltransferase